MHARTAGLLVNGINGFGLPDGPEVDRDCRARVDRQASWHVALNKCSFWRSQNEWPARFAGGRLRCTMGQSGRAARRAQQPSDKSPEQAGRPAVRARLPSGSHLTKRSSPDRRHFPPWLPPSSVVFIRLPASVATSSIASFWMP